MRNLGHDLGEESNAMSDRMNEVQDARLPEVTILA